MQLEGAIIERLVPVLVQGADARKFMQGQFTQDVTTLGPERALLGSSNTGQGRVQMVATLVDWGADLLLLCPRGVLQANLERLRRSIISAKVGFEPMAWTVAALSEAAATAVLGHAPPHESGACDRQERACVIRWWGDEPRWLLIAPGPLPAQMELSTSSGDRDWHAADVRMGLPQVYSQTLMSFVPHMLNLDRLDGIHFNKGCYVGQEVVARARFKGVPRRMFGYVAPCAAPDPGSPVLRAGAEVGEVVDAVALEAGCALLAVVSGEPTDDALCLGDIARSPLRHRPLPYA